MIVNVDYTTSIPKTAISFLANKPTLALFGAGSSREIQCFDRCLISGVLDPRFVRGYEKAPKLAHIAVEGSQIVLRSCHALAFVVD